MPSNRKQHFVPKFFLRGFASAPKQIHLFNKERKRNIFDASLKDQCQKSNFYDDDDSVDAELRRLENDLAPAFVAFRDRSTTRVKESDIKEAVMEVMIMLYGRTQRRFEQHQRIVDADSLPFHHPSGTKVQLDVSREVSPLEMLALNYRGMIDGIAGLRYQLVKDPSESFLVGDAPVVLYNQYCEGTNGVGVLGLLKRGIQIFLPLSPKLSMVAYDAQTYRLRTSKDRSNNISFATKSDVRSMNILQMSNALNNVYFSKCDVASSLEEVLDAIPETRIEDLDGISDFHEEVGPDMIRMYYSRMVDLGIELSFMRIKPGAARIPISKRIQLLRNVLTRPASSLNRR